MKSSIDQDMSIQDVMEPAFVEKIVQGSKSLLDSLRQSVTVLKQNNVDGRNHSIDDREQANNEMNPYEPKSLNHHQSNIVSTNRLSMIDMDGKTPNIKDNLELNDQTMQILAISGAKLKRPRSVVRITNQSMPILEDESQNGVSPNDRSIIEARHSQQASVDSQLFKKILEQEYPEMGDRLFQARLNLKRPSTTVKDFPMRNFHSRQTHLNSQSSRENKTPQQPQQSSFNISGLFISGTRPITQLKIGYSAINFRKNKISDGMGNFSSGNQSFDLKKVHSLVFDPSKHNFNNVKGSSFIN